MKKRLSTFLSLLLVIVFAACEKNSDSGNPIDPVPFSGNWKMIYFNDGENLQMGRYADYTFDFKPNQAVTARTPDGEVPGYWALSSNGQKVFNLRFNNGDANLTELNNNWEAITVNELEIRLADSKTGAQLYFDRQPDTVDSTGTPNN